MWEFHAINFAIFNAFPVCDSKSPASIWAVLKVQNWSLSLLTVHSSGQHSNLVEYMASLLEAVEFFPVISTLLLLFLIVQDSLQKAIGFTLLLLKKQTFLDPFRTRMIALMCSLRLLPGRYILSECPILSSLLMEILVSCLSPVPQHGSYDLLWISMMTRGGCNTSNSARSLSLN